MTHYMTKHFKSNLARFRNIADLSRAEVCDRMQISHKTYNRLNVIHRHETGKLTRNEAAAINLQRLIDYTGDRDPQTIPASEYVDALGITKGQAWRYRLTLIRMRATSVEIPPPPPRPEVSHRVQRAERMFWIQGERLFSKNREPAEVGA